MSIVGCSIFYFGTTKSCDKFIVNYLNLFPDIKVSQSCAAMHLTP